MTKKEQERIVYDICFGQNIATYTGHRPKRYVDAKLVPYKYAYDKTYEWNKQRILETHKLVDYMLFHGYTVHITGGAIGTDQDVGLRLNEIMKLSSYTASCKGEEKIIDTSLIRHIVAVPCLNQDNRWSKESQEVYRQMLADASCVYYCDRGSYSPRKMIVRDMWMVNNAHILGACYLLGDCTDSHSGTGHTLKYALKQNKPIVGFHPDTLKRFTEKSVQYYVG